MLSDQLRKQIDAQLSDARKDAAEKVRKMAANIESLDGFVDLDKDERKRLFAQSEEIIAEINDASLIAVIRNKLNQYTIEGYQKQLTLLNESLKERRQSEGVEEPPARYVTRMSVPIAFRKQIIASEKDLMDYLKALETAFRKALKEGKRIALQDEP